MKATPPALGLYLHIPFCKSKCVYCDFYSLAGREDRMDAYQKALETQDLAGLTKLLDDGKRRKEEVDGR